MGNGFSSKEKTQYSISRWNNSSQRIGREEEEDVGRALSYKL